MSEPIQSSERQHTSRYRSFFWPIILIGVGVVWLLVNLNIIQVESLGGLLRFWPVILILVGLDIIFSRRYSLVGALLGLLTIGLVIVVLVFGSQLLPEGQTRILGFPINFGSGSEITSEKFSEPMGEAQTAVVELNLSRWHTTVSSLKESANLVEADVDYTGDFTFTSEGDQNKVVRVGQPGVNVQDWFLFTGQADYRWDIVLTSDIPLELRVNTGSGSNTFTLTDLQLRRVEFEGGSGSTTLALPVSEDRLPVAITSHSGSFTLSMPDNSIADLEVDAGSGSVQYSLGDSSNVTLRWKGASGSQNIEIGNAVTLDATIESGSGSVTIDIPDDAAVRLEVVDAGSGSVNVPGWAARLQGSGKEGVWESTGYGSASTRITIRLTSRSGSVTIR